MYTDLNAKGLIGDLTYRLAVAKAQDLRAQLVTAREKIGNDFALADADANANEQRATRES